MEEVFNYYGITIYFDDLAEEQPAYESYLKLEELKNEIKQSQRGIEK